MKEEAKNIFAVGQSVEPKKNKSFLIGQGVGDMMSEKLKPCPFCGRTVNITYNSLEKRFFVWHTTYRCGIEEPISIDEPKSFAEAYQVWNRRAE